MQVATLGTAVKQLFYVSYLLRVQSSQDMPDDLERIAHETAGLRGTEKPQTWTWKSQSLLRRVDHVGPTAQGYFHE